MKPQNLSQSFHLKGVKTCFFILSECPSNRITLNANPNQGQMSATERRVPELIPVLGSQPAGDVSHKPGGRLPLLSARPAVTPATLKRAATDFAVW